MKHLAILFCLFMSRQIAHAQFSSDITQSDTSLYWYASHDPCSLSGCTHYETGEHFVGKDTLLGGVHYSITKNGLQEGFFRTDNNQRVYALDAADTAENLLYDFGAQIGDTIYFKAFIVDSFKTYFYAIDSTDSVLISGQYRKRMHVSTNIDTSGIVPVQYFNLSWIEGVGEEYYGLHSIFVDDLVNGFNFCGIWQNSHFIYGAHATCYEVTGVRELAFSDRIRIYPTPAEDILSIENNTSERLNSFDIISLSGQSIYRGDLAGDEKGGISVAAIPSGLYFLQVTDDKGNIYTQKMVKK